MEFSLTIQCDNAAFEHDPGLEVAYILRRLAHRAEAEGLEALDNAALWDENGNKVGTCHVKA